MQAARFKTQPAVVALMAARRAIRFHETDRAGMVFHGAFVGWFQDAFEDMMARSGFVERHLEERLGVRVPVVRLEIDFQRHPSGDEVEVGCRPVKLGRSSATFEVWVDDADGRCATGTVVRVCIGEAGGPVAIPPPLRDAWTAPMLDGEGPPPG